jgi:hypothetical protein
LTYGDISVAELALLSFVVRSLVLFRHLGGFRLGVDGGLIVVESLLYHGLC